MPEDFDLIIIGGGRASGLATAAAQAGWKTALIEKDKLGGTCPNRGCVPSKLLIGFSEAARRVRGASRHFIEAELRSIDTNSILDSIGGWVEGVDGRYEGRLETAGVEIIRGEARFCGYKQVEAEGRVLRADKIVVATGGRPTDVGYGDLPIWTSDSVFPPEGEFPKSILIVGGGVIGVELASCFSGLGVQTTLFARGARLLNREDGEIEEVFRSVFSEEVEVFTETTVEDLSYNGSEFRVGYASGDVVGEMNVERVLFAVGRRPNTEKLNLAATNLASDSRGFLPVNEHLETDVEGIYAVGDVNGRFMLQHAASNQVFYLRQKFFRGYELPIDDRLVGHAIYSHPELASVGLTEDQAVASGVGFVVASEDWQASARVMAQRIEYPRVKLIVSSEDYEILGCHLVGPESSTLLHQVLMLMRLKNDVRELANMIYVHPALNECLLVAAVKAVKMIRSRNTA